MAKEKAVYRTNDGCYYDSLEELVHEEGISIEETIVVEKFVFVTKGTVHRDVTFEPTKVNKGNVFVGEERLIW